MNESGESPERNPKSLSPELDTGPAASDNVNSDIGESVDTSDNSEIAAAVCTSAEDADTGPEDVEVGAGDAHILLKSMLKLSNEGPSKKVQFADDKDQILVTYGDVPSPNPWGRKELSIYTKDEIIEAYTRACTKVHTIVQDSIVSQLQAIQCNTDYSLVLNLGGIELDIEIVDTLEPLFNMLTFQCLSIDKSASQYITEILDMLEYYDSVRELVLMGIDKTESSVYRSIANVLANTQMLRSISFRDMSFGDGALRVLFEEGLNCGFVRRIRFDACGLNRTPTFMLAHHLRNNDYVRELHLCYLDLYSREAETIGKYLSMNNCLRVLDLSNNKLGDKGVEVLCRGIYDQATKGSGLKVLIICNNNLTKRCVETINTIIGSCPTIEVINIGNNDLTDEFLYEAKLAIQKSTTLTSLGLQSTLVTCLGIMVLTEALQINKSLRNLNLRGNKAIQPGSLNTLADVIHKTSLVQIDLDDTNRTCSNPQTFAEIVNKVRQVTAVNKTRLREESQAITEELVHDNWLSCEPTYVPKTSIRLIRTGYTNRFTVAPVSEKITSPRPSTSHRFTVVPAGSGDTLVAPASTSPPPKSNRQKKFRNITAAGDAPFSITEDERMSDIMTLHSSLSALSVSSTYSGNTIPEDKEEVSCEDIVNMSLSPEKAEAPIIGDDKPMPIHNESPVEQMDTSDDIDVIDEDTLGN